MSLNSILVSMQDSGHARSFPLRPVVVVVVVVVEHTSLTTPPTHREHYQLTIRRLGRGIKDTILARLLFSRHARALLASTWRFPLHIHIHIHPLTILLIYFLFRPILSPSATGGRILFSLGHFGGHGETSIRRAFHSGRGYRTEQIQNDATT